MIVSFIFIGMTGGTLRMVGGVSETGDYLLIIRMTRVTGWHPPRTMVARVITARRVLVTGRRPIRSAGMTGVTFLRSDKVTRRLPGCLCTIMARGTRILYGNHGMIHRSIGESTNGMTEVAIGNRIIGWYMIWIRRLVHIWTPVAVTIGGGTAIHNTRMVEGRRGNKAIGGMASATILIRRHMARRFTRGNQTIVAV